MKQKEKKTGNALEPVIGHFFKVLNFIQLVKTLPGAFKTM